MEQMASYFRSQAAKKKQAAENAQAQTQPERVRM
jgi:hypothetical protein